MRISSLGALFLLVCVGHTLSCSLLDSSTTTGASSKTPATSATTTPEPTASPVFPYSTTTEVGHTTTHAIPQYGGAASSAGKGAQVVVPSGALATAMNITIVADDASSYPSQAQLLSNVYDVGPDGTQFKRDLYIAVTATKDVPAGMRPVLAFLNAGNAWQVVGVNSYDAKKKIAHGQIDHFTHFAILAIPIDGTGCAQSPDPNAYCYPNPCDGNTNVCGGAALQSEFTISGRVSGLTVYPLTLTNGSDTVTVTTNGQFIFPTGQVTGTAYAVALAQQPNNTYCTLANASGTVTTYVNNIVVTCLPMVGLGGTVTGLDAGNEMTLQNGNHQVIIDAATPQFSLPRVLSGLNYNVTIAIQPTGQICTIAYPTGMATRTDVSLQVVCRNAYYTLGGTVTGLLGNANFVLHSLRDNLPVHNGPYVFPTRVAYDATYAVTITSPAGQACVFAAPNTGVGVMPAGNVGNLNITCTPIAYPLSGTVTGLAFNANVTLHDANDSISIGNGAYQFPTPVPYASSVNITVAQPAGQTCRFGNYNTFLTFAMGYAAVTTVNLACSTNKYSVGGVVTGLLANQRVQLMNNGSNLMTAGNGNYFFATQLPFNAGYNVTLVSPKGQTCVIGGNSTGLVGAGNVTTVAVACSPLPYTVGGLITGLSGNTNVVLTSGNDTVPFGNGAYRFPTPVAYNSNYSVTVTTSPAGQLCRFPTHDSNHGVMGSANVTNANVTCTPLVVTYSIGGIVRGLSPNTTVNLLNGNDSINVSTGGFFFPTSVIHGGNFSVSFVQPPGQTCAFVGGHAGVANANVSGILVNCTQYSYKLGGNVSGLVPGTYVRLTSASDIYSATNGTYAFETSRVFNTGYSAALTSPANHTCRFSPLDGNVGVIGAGDVTDLNVVCMPFTYHLSGTISGLPANTNITLTNGNDSVTQGNGAFTFAAPVSYGANYNILITVPAGQRCVFSPTTAGNANMPASDVGNVGVVCGTIKYSIGGVVSGLSGTVQLVNGADTLSRSVNGSFSMPTSVFTATDYNVMVSTQPNNQLCVVSQGAGTVGAANITTAQVTCTGNYALSADVTGLIAGGNVILANGSDTLTVLSSSPNVTFATRIGARSNYAVTVVTQPVGQTCTLAAASGTMPTRDLALAVQCNVTLSFTTAQPATWVIGQTDFTSTATTGDGVHLSAPLGAVFLAPSGDLYIGDQQHYRIVGYHNGIPTANGRAFDFVVGQASLTSTTAPSTPAANTYMPRTVVGNQNYWVQVDGLNSRVLILRGFPQSTVNANYVLGQSSFTTNSTACTQAGLSAPRGASVTASNKLLVADTANNRVLIWSSMPASNGAGASLVLGQINFTTCTQPSSNAGTAATLSQPYDVWSDGTHVLVADTFANRVLIWNTFPTVNGQAADAVLGQTAFASTTAGAGPVSVGEPAGVTSDGNSIFVSEYSYSRVSQWSGVPWKNQTPTQSAVLGELDASNATCNLGNGAPAVNSVCQTAGVTIVGSQLVVTDFSNNRLLVFQSH